MNNMILKENLERKQNLETQLYGIIELLEELLKLQEYNYEPYKEQQTKLAIRALLNIVGLKSLKVLHRNMELMKQ